MTARTGKPGLVTVAAVVVLFAAVVAVLAARSGVLPGVGGQTSARHLEAGPFAFVYPKGWSRLPDATRTAPVGGDELGGTVVAGLCAGGAGACTADVDVSYVLFRSQAKLPGLASLEGRLDEQLPQHYAGFARVRAEQRTSRDGTRYLWYEFTHRSGGGRTGEVIAGFVAPDGENLLVVAAGPAERLAQQRPNLRSLLDSAVAAA